MGFACAGHFLCHGSKVALPVVLSLAAADFGVDLPHMALAVTVFSLGMGLASVPAGLLSDRLGTARVMTLYCWALAVGAALCWRAPGYGSFLAAHAVLGLAAGLYHPAGLGLISLVADGARMGPAFGIHGVVGSVGVTVVPLLMLRLVGQAGWRTGYAALAVVAVLVALAGHVLRRRVHIDQAAARLAAAAPADPERARRGLLLLMVVISVNAFLLDGFLTMFPETVRRQAGPGLAPDMVMMVILAVGGVGQYLGGLWARGRSESARYVLLVGVQALVFCSAALLGGRAAVLLALLGAFAFANYMTQPIENHLLAAYTSRSRRGRAYALKFLVALVVGSPAPWVVAWMAEHQGLPAMYALLAAVGALGLLAGARFLRRAEGLQAG